MESLHAPLCIPNLCPILPHFPCISPICPPFPPIFPPTITWYPPPPVPVALKTTVFHLVGGGLSPFFHSVFWERQIFT